MGEVIDASDRFAMRVAKWLNDSKMNSLEMSHRLSIFPNHFILKVVAAHKKLVAEKQRGR